MPSPTITFRLSEQDKQQIQKIASAKGITTTQFILEAVKEKIFQEEDK